jgi:hypothetical protein
MNFNLILERKFHATIQEQWLCIAYKERVGHGKRVSQNNLTFGCISNDLTCLHLGNLKP